MRIAPDQHIGPSAIDPGGKIDGRTLNSSRVGKQAQPRPALCKLCDPLHSAIGAAAIRNNDANAMLLRPIHRQRVNYPVYMGALVERRNYDKNRQTHLNAR